MIDLDNTQSATDSALFFVYLCVLCESVIKFWGQKFDLVEIEFLLLSVNRFLAQHVVHRTVAVISHKHMA